MDVALAPAASEASLAVCIRIQRHMQTSTHVVCDVYCTCIQMYTYVFVGCALCVFVCIHIHVGTVGFVFSM